MSCEHLRFRKLTVCDLTSKKLIVKGEVIAPNIKVKGGEANEAEILREVIELGPLPFSVVLGSVPGGFEVSGTLSITGTRVSLTLFGNDTLTASGNGPLIVLESTEPVIPEQFRPGGRWELQLQSVLVNGNKSPMVNVSVLPEGGLQLLFFWNDASGDDFVLNGEQGTWLSEQ